MRSAILASALTLVAMPAAAFIARNDLVVVPGAGPDFSVPYRGLTGASDFWCAAGDYVMRGLHQPGNTRVYRSSPPPRRSGEGISFTLDASRATDSGLALLGSPDRGISAVFAQSFCDDQIRPLRP